MTVVLYPTDLTPDEEQHARHRLANLADRFVADGDLRTPEWRDAFQSTWRHPYVPAYYPDTDRPPVLCVDPAGRADWLDAVYSNETLITKVQPVPLSRAFRPATGWMYTSSSTLPLLVLRMLESLDVRDGQRVLEIGTGSGYNCALLCRRLGDRQVVSMDVDPELVELAGERLAANGHTPTLVVADGAQGHASGAPYDRLIATCAVSHIPPAWLRQVRPGGVILTDVHGLLGGTVVRLTVAADGTATGPFVPYWTGFMQLRRTAAAQLHDPHPWLDDPGVGSTTGIDPARLMREGDMLGFLAQWQLTDGSRGFGTSDTGGPAVFLSAPDGSRAVVALDAPDGTHRVVQSGPRRLWDLVERVHDVWRHAGRPGFERFGITATPIEQYVWLDDPHGSHRWPLAAPPSC